MKNNKLHERIKELEAENARLRHEINHASGYLEAISFMRGCVIQDDFADRIKAYADKLGGQDGSSKGV